MELPSTKFLILAGVIILNLFLANLVYYNDKKNATNRVFAVLGIVMSIWLFSIYLSVTPVANLFWTRVTVCLATFMSVTFFLFAHTLPKDNLQLNKKKFVIILIGTLMIAFITLSPFTFTHVEEIDGALKTVPGPGMLPFALFTTFFSVSAFYFLFKKFKCSLGKEKKQLGFILSGIFLMLILIITTIMIPIIIFNNDFFIQFAPLYAFIFLAMTAVAILKYHLFDIKIVATEILVFVLVASLLVEGFSSGSAKQAIFRTSFAILVSILCVSLVHSVTKEIKQREEVAHLAQSLEKANLRLQEIDKQKTEFLSIASHQLRTPLSIIKGYIELIEDGAYGKPTRKMDHVLHDMDSSNEHLVKLVDEFLDITRIEQGRTKYTFEPRDMVALINGVVKELTEKSEEKKMHIKWTPPKDTCIIPMDEEKIRHVVFNFVDNAIKYSEKGTVRVELAEEEKGITVRVKDRGLGFGSEDQANFFQKFYRGENVKGTNVTGTGLGIYVCRKFIEGHNGKVWAKSKGLGKGSEFGFWVPLSSS